MAWDLARILNNSFSFRFSYFILRFLLPWFLCLPCVIFFVCVLFALSCLICLHMSSMQKFNYLHFRSTQLPSDVLPRTRPMWIKPRRPARHQTRASLPSWWSPVSVASRCCYLWWVIKLLLRDNPLTNNTHDLLSSCSLAIATAASDASIRWTSRIPSTARPRQKIISVCAKIFRRVSTTTPASWMRR